MKFIYKLEPVKKVKDIMEKKIQEEISELDNEISLQTELFNSTTAKRESFLNEDRSHISSAELKYVREYIAHINNEIKNISAKMDELQFERNKKTQELVQISKEKKMHEKLKEIHKVFFNEHEKKMEEDFLNELAVQGYARKNEA